MPYKHPELQSNAPYYDDFEDTKNFLKVLFKPGYAVQARELTQVQSILQSQVAKFADHIFVDGSQILGGKVNVSPVNYIRVERFLSSSAGVLSSTTTNSYMESIVRTQISYDGEIQTNQILGVVEKKQLEVYKYNTETSDYAEEASATVLMLHYAPSGYSSTDNYNVLFFMPLTGSDDGIGVRDILKVKNEEIYFRVINPTKDELSGVYAVSPFGTANLVSVDDGIFYLDGLFVKNYNQILAPYYDSTNPDDANTAFSEDGQLYDMSESNVRLFTYPTVRIGFTANKSVVTANDDTTLRDPASGFYNANAPGADRYTVDLVLSQLTFDKQSLDVENYSNSDFIQLARMVNGKTDWIRRLTNYSEIMELFARRTYDESGSYTVRPFQVEVKNHYRNDYYEVLVLDQQDPDFVVGSYVYSQPGINPFQTGFDFNEYAVLEVLSIVPYEETLSEININSFLVRMKSKSPKRISFNSEADGFGYGSLLYMKPGSGTARSIKVKLRSYNIDPSGTYSPQDLPAGDTSKMVLSVQPGKAYVYGYEYENYYPTNTEYEKRDNDSKAQQDILLDSYNLLGNYVVGSFAQDTVQADIDWERLPKFKLNSDDLFILVIQEGENITAEAPIYSWSPYKLWSSGASKYIKGITETDRKYESVIFVEDTQ